ncbi:single-stranded DNA-binding protein [Staphylococcus xylosus]|uniref:single-stranded DNA-binding protein n=1 Tax=Staphylococcus TaxID=1279 RepID=UPI001952398A|nr:single-stranded DNA-binding protein [Staphylococcus xylosus]MBM6639484.1 single-stranded DNA-binding protein [Staphylococcus xylosus]
MNSLILTGRLTKEVEIKEITKKNGEITNIGTGTIAVAKSKDQADFFHFKIWGDKAQNLKEYTTKGSNIQLQGKLKQNTFETESGKQFFTYMLVLNFETSDSKSVTESLRAKNEHEENPFNNTDKDSVYNMKGYEEMRNAEDEDLPF